MKYCNRRSYGLAWHASHDLIGDLLDQTFEVTFAHGGGIFFDAPVFATGTNRARPWLKRSQERLIISADAAAGGAGEALIRQPEFFFHFQ
ncbi:MAG: hypothetical protein M1588_04185 [Planctomycetes bacterium]|nr:hypothetical protein [Planctomycetota bacterium]